MIQALDELDCPRRVLLSGTPMQVNTSCMISRVEPPLSNLWFQNDLEEFYAMASFTNPAVFGDPKEFRTLYANPILAGREPDASDLKRKKAERAALKMSKITEAFVIRRTNDLLSGVEQRF